MCHEWHAHHHFAQMVFWDRKYDAANTNEIKPCRMCFTCFNPLRFSPSFCLTLPFIWGIGDLLSAHSGIPSRSKVSSDTQRVPDYPQQLNTQPPVISSQWIEFAMEKKQKKKNIIPCSSMCSSMIYKNRKNLLKNCGYFFPWPSCWFHAPRSRDLRRRR